MQQCIMDKLRKKNQKKKNWEIEKKKIVFDVLSIKLKFKCEQKRENT